MYHVYVWMEVSKEYRYWNSFSGTYDEFQKALKDASVLVQGLDFLAW